MIVVLNVCSFKYFY